MLEQNVKYDRNTAANLKKSRLVLSFPTEPFAHHTRRHTTRRRRMRDEQGAMIVNRITFGEAAMRDTGL